MAAWLSCSTYYMLGPLARMKTKPSISVRKGSGASGLNSTPCNQVDIFNGVEVIVLWVFLTMEDDRKFIKISTYNMHPSFWEIIMQYICFNLLIQWSPKGWCCLRLQLFGQWISLPMKFQTNALVGKIVNWSLWPCDCPSWHSKHPCVSSNKCWYPPCICCSQSQCQ